MVKDPRNQRNLKGHKEETVLNKIRQGKTSLLRFDLSEADYKMAKRQARKRGLSFSDYIRYLINEYHRKARKDEER